MTEVRQRSDTLEGRLWDTLEAKGVGFLGLTKSGLHPQPAVVFVDRRRRRLWLAALTDTELVRSVGEGGAAIFTAQDAGLLASISGNLTVEEDVRRLARLWTPQAQAWRPEGPGDRALTLLRLDCVDAEVSLADLGMRRFIWELAPTALRRRPPSPASSSQPTLH
ncbi:MAG: pyridoxamine 5'-phosphate oxidase family protein [Phenylobacterium sp.]